MGLSTRILMRICLPSGVLAVGLGVAYHHATEEHHVAAAEARLEQAATTIGELIGYRCDEIAQHLTELLHDGDAQRALAASPGAATLEARAAREAVAERLRRSLANDPRILRLELHAGDGEGLLGIDRDGGSTPPEGGVDAPWLEETLASGRHRSWTRGGADPVARIAVALRAPDADRALVGVALVDFKRIALPAIHSATQGLGAVRARVESLEGRVSLGPLPLDPADRPLARQAGVPGLGGRVRLELPRQQVLAGLLTFERDALVVLALLIACVAALLWTGLQALVLTPLRGMLRTVAAFEAGEPVPPPQRRSRTSGELAVLDGALRTAFQASAENRHRLQELNNSLEARVRERTAELEHNANALRLARDEAARADEAKGRFIANVSHEVRTPLNAIIGMTDMLADTRLDDEQSECVEAVRRAGEDLLALINQILDLAKVEAGRLQLEHIEFDLVESLDGVVSLLGPSARQKGLALERMVAPGCPTRLRGDPVRLRQVLVNLVGNAIKFTTAGHVELRAALEPEGGLWAEAGQRGSAAAGSGATPAAPGRGTALRFEVRDTGIGLSDEARRRLFEPFSQAERSTTREFGGTGLGLAICKQVVERMGGRIGVRSEPGRGSAFWFVVPLEAVADGGLVGRTPMPQRWELSGLRVLVASFQPASRRLVEQTLEACGTLTDAAATPAAALQLAQQGFATGRPFHAALIDENLPGEGAAGLARALRADPALARIPLLLMSRDDDPTAARSGGFDLGLAKPVNTVQLVDALCAVVGGDGHRPDAEARSPAPAEAPARTPRSAPSTATAPRQPAPPPTAAAGSGDRGHVLLVEDNAVNQRVATRTLQKLGFRVQVVADGAAAVQAVARGRYDAVLMDLQMPVMDGYEATRRIRAAEARGEHVPIVALTAHAMAGDRERALADGLDDYVCKPVRPADLAAVLDRWLGDAGPARDPPSREDPP